VPAESCSFAGRDSNSLAPGSGERERKARRKRKRGLPKEHLMKEEKADVCM